jgi:predicted unusual protein kinase regulating ubiquinone biosynthesis (AarF/ABC1/UbiB family)
MTIFKMTIFKMTILKMKYLKNLYYIILDFYCKSKYFIYFNIFLNVIFINYVYYTIFGVTSDNLIMLLNYSINLNGCILIKLIQWLNNHILFVKNDEAKNTAITKLFSKYYENCSIHSLKYTKNLFFKEFGYLFDDIFILDETFSIKSGSIAQVYKAHFKNNGNNINSTCFVKEPIAIKVVHPEIEYQMLFPIYFINIYKFFVSTFTFLKKYDTIINYDSFFYNLRNQINMVNEYENNIYFYNKYINNDVIVIPKPLIKSKNFLIMEYIEGEFLEKMDVSIYKKQILMSFLSIFIKDTYMFGKYIHCDLHDANWKVLKQKKNKSYNSNNDKDDDDRDDGFIYKIVIYDFGYIIENNSNEHIKNLIYYLDLNNTYEIGKILFEHIENLKIKSTNSLEFLDYKENLIATFVKYNERCYPYTQSNLLACYNFCYSNEYKLKNNLLDLFVSIMLLNKYFKKYLFSDCINDDTKCFNEKKYYDSVYNINLFYISICEKYNIFHNVKDFLNNKYINNSFFIEKINYNNSYFNSLIEDKDLLNKNNNFDI